MKKLLVIGTLLLSASAFSAGKMEGMMQGGSMGGGMGQEMSCPMMQKMMTPEMRKAMTQQHIAMEEKQLELHKALAEDKVDWDKVGKINKEIADMKADMQTNMMKMHAEMMQNTQQEPEKKQ